MMRTLGRLIGWLILAAGLVAGGLDLLASLRDGALVLTPLGQYWFEIHASSLNAAQAGIERHVWRPLWQDFIQPLLEFPAVIVLCLLGAAILMLARKRGGGRWFSRK
ncbi:MAG: hypothetical protein WDZ84_02925 [Rhodovibrionaceae bacterium]